jgi:DNA-binding NarL/FixJ family response regulator
VTPLTTRIMLADDHAVVRHGLQMVLEAQPDMKVVAEVGDGAEAVKRGLEDDVDLAIIDISMPRMTRYLYEALKAGASGYVVKTVADRDLVEAVRATMRGEKFLYPGAMSPLIEDFLRRARQDLPVREDPLTPREQEVVKLVAEGYTNKQIAETLVISEKTVERHRANILEKLGMRDRVELTRYAIRHGLIEP